MKKISLFLLATMLLSLFSCKKEETKPNDTDKTNPTRLTESSWKVGSKTFTATFCVGEEANVFSSPMYRLRCID